MSLTFYYAPMSTASITHLVLAELGVPCEMVKIDIKNGEQKKPDYLKLNPNGKVPTIVHDGTSIWESTAITMYLGETFGVEKKLYPAPGPKRGEAMRWITWANVSLGEAVYRWAHNTQWQPAEMRNAKVAEGAMGDIQTHLGILNDGLAGKQYLLGNDYSLADAHLCSYTDWLRHMKVDFAKFDNINAWSKRCAARPAYAKVMADEMPKQN